MVSVMCANEASPAGEGSQCSSRRGPRPGHGRSPHRSVRLLAIRFLLATLSVSQVIAAEVEAPRTTIAVVDFDYLDTSGESRDQAAFHAERISELARSLRSDLEGSKPFKVVSITCMPEPCSLTGSEPAELVAAARRAGVRLLLFGGVHKQSTLVQWAKVQVLDVQSEKLLFERLMTFRGDDTTAWRQLEKYMMKDLLRQSATLHPPESYYFRETARAVFAATGDLRVRGVSETAADESDLGSGNGFRSGISVSRMIDVLE